MDEFLYANFDWKIGIFIFSVRVNIYVYILDRKLLKKLLLPRKAETYSVHMVSRGIT